LKIIKYSLTIAAKESINITLDRLSYILKNSSNLKEILWTLQIYKNNDLYLEYINTQLKELKEEYNKFGETDIEEYVNNKMKKDLFVFEQLILNNKTLSKLYFPI
jgi:uncharacterized protein (DUF1015 family)